MSTTQKNLPKNRKVLVTGSSGFIGGYIAKELLKEGFQVIAQRNLSPLSEEIREKCHEIVCDFSKPKNIESFLALLSELEPELVIHAAAISKIDTCEQDPIKALLINNEATEKIANYYGSLETSKTPTLIYLSTDMVFEGCENTVNGFSESDCPKPLSVYAKSKLEGEKAWLKLAANAAIFRISLCYGIKNKGVLGWMGETLKGLKTLNLYKDEWRTPLYVSDILSSILAFDNHKTNGCELFHLGGPKRVSRFEMGLLFANASGLNSSNIQATKRAAHAGMQTRAEDLSLNSDKIKSVLSVKTTSLERAFAMICAEKECEMTSSGASNT